MGISFVSDPTRLTSATGAFVVGTRVHLGTIRGDGAIIQLDTKAPIYGIEADTRCESQRRTVNALKHVGSANFRGGAFSLATLKIRTFRYASVEEFIATAEVCKDMTADEKRILTERVAAYYEFDAE